MTSLTKVPPMISVTASLHVPTVGTLNGTLHANANYSHVRVTLDGNMIYDLFHGVGGPFDIINKAPQLRDEICELGTELVAKARNAQELTTF